MDLNHLTQPSDLMSELLLTQPEILFRVSWGHFPTAFVYLIVKLGLANTLLFFKHFLRLMSVHYASFSEMSIVVMKCLIQQAK